MKVRNIISERSGRPVANQFVIEHDGKAVVIASEKLLKREKSGLM